MWPGRNLLVFEAKLFELLQAEVKRDATFFTLGLSPKPNHVVEVTPEGLYVETESSKDKGNPPQLIPAWMFELAWDYLRQHKTLGAAYLQANDGLNVKRSSGVCAILARLPGVSSETGRLITLKWESQSAGIP